MINKIFVTAALTIALSLKALGQMPGGSISLSDLPSELEQKIAEFGKQEAELMSVGIHSIDEDGDGKVPLKSLLKTLMGRGFAREGTVDVPESLLENGATKESFHKEKANMDKMVARYFKPDAEGNFGAEEMEKMFNTALPDVLIGRNFSLDVDKNFSLTLQEFATGIPIRKGEETDADGYTATQKEYFAEVDQNGDGAISGSEWLPDQTLHMLEEITDVLTLTLYIGKFDTDSDGNISKDELSKLYPKGEEMFPASFPLAETIHYLRIMDHELVHKMADALIEKE